MRYPEFLPANGTIGFISPSFGCAEEPYVSAFSEALKFFEKQGYHTLVGPNAYVSKGVGKSNTARACGEEVNDFFLNKKTDVIISCGGGETMCEDLPYVDFAGIRREKPKWYLGYSDNTNLTFTLPTLCDTAAVYGPCASEFGMQPLHPAVLDALKVLTGEKLTETNYDGWESEQTKSVENPLASYNINEPYEQIFAGTAKPGDTFSGRLLGGCCDCLVNLLGTPFDRVREFKDRYKEDGIIWFIEACDLNPMSYRRALWQLGQAGWFEGAKGFLIGRSVHFKDDFAGYTNRDAVKDMLAQYKAPIVMDIDLGHMSPQMPFISGAYGTVTTTENTISIRYELR